VAQAVVDLLEVVQVQEDQGEALGKPIFEASLQGPPVQEAGEPVVAGLPFQLQAQARSLEGRRG
jgi:hypothetical protein